MAQNPHQASKLTGPLAARLRRPLTLTWAGLLAERLVRAFWPLWTLLIAVAGALMMGLPDFLSYELIIGSAIAVGLGALALLVVGLARFRWPRRGEALARLDAALPGRPLQALGDAQAIGRGDAASEALWAAHRSRMEQAAAKARAPSPDLKVARLDPFGLRYIALLGLVVAMLFGSVLRLASPVPLGPSGAALASGPTWEGWIEPPVYTGLPTLYLADQGTEIAVPEGSRVMIRLYGELGALTLTETVSGRTDDLDAATDAAQGFDVVQDGVLTIDGPGGRSWDVRAVEDAAPTAQVLAEGAKTTFDGQMSQPYAATDDYGVVGGSATFALDLNAVDRRYGLAPAPEPREPIALDLPLPITGDRTDFTEALVENLSEHPWAHLPVTLTITAEDAAGQTGSSAPMPMELPARRFFDPLAAAIIEQRRDLLWSRENGRRVAQVIRAVSYQPEEKLFRDPADFLKLRTILRRLEASLDADGLTPETRDALAQALWDLAVALEDGDIGDALERMREAQERLSEAMRNGASEDEVARLMQELRDATDDYLRQKSQQAQRENGTDQPDQGDQNMTMLSQQDLQDMMDRIQELMQEGRMAEAEEALRQFQEMMENLRVTEGQPGQGEGSPGQQAMEGLADTLREQQGLSDQAFRDLQEQFNPGAQAGQSQGNEGRNGGQGRGESHEGQGGQGQSQSGDGESNGGEGQQEQSGQGGGQPGDLAARQEALRQELERQRGSLPGSGEAADAARGALDRAGEAMDGAEEALRQNDLAGAIDRQAEAMDALRDGMRNLGEAMAEESGQRQGGQGQASGATGGQQSDPLGRTPGQGDRAGTEGNLLQGDDVYRRARELLDELRRRSGEGARPEVERDYLERLLERF
ncbi:TIGR02302 family protein [Roseovarius nanhaiticus]|uniref:TIGR02302 family protein n=1 Tax=Roseovarius nanhaiticus TaxID=573024 RepID=A0A1N7GYX7_9RHOB|nr:TIGR02302 family protein [Roseovarius nanhaiticus]SEL19640.1 TIGR02302 family protein [Roseovarius nanhaiticus]SIS17648.1 TIGR02302 family protein [Roseovarius nanhaiticus]